MLAKGHDGQEGDLRQAHKVFQKLNFYCCNGRVGIHASVERLLQREKGSKNKGQWKLSVVLGVSLTRCRRWDNTKSFLDHGRVFPSLTSTSEMVYPSQLQLKRAAPSNRKLLHSQLPSR